MSSQQQQRGRVSQDGGQNNQQTPAIVDNVVGSNNSNSNSNGDPDVKRMQSILERRAERKMIESTLPPTPDEFPETIRTNNNSGSIFISSPSPKSTTTATAALGTPNNNNNKNNNNNRRSLASSSATTPQHRRTNSNSNTINNGGDGSMMDDNEAMKRERKLRKKLKEQQRRLETFRFWKWDEVGMFTPDDDVGAKWESFGIATKRNIQATQNQTSSAAQQWMTNLVTTVTMTTLVDYQKGLEAIDTARSILKEVNDAIMQSQRPPYLPLSLHHYHHHQQQTTTSASSPTTAAAAGAGAAAAATTSHRL